jgi:hypothetical protein
MTPHETHLIQKLDQEIKNLSVLMQGTEAGESLTLKEIRHLLYELNKQLPEDLSNPKDDYKY